MAVDGTRLTKKQKKATAFRERKGKKKLPADVPEDGSDLELDTLAEIGTINTDEHKSRLQLSEAKPDNSPKTSRKRKREDVGVVQPEDAENGESVETGKRKKVEGAEDQSSGRRLILFVGNLKYTTPREVIQEHFSACDPPPVVRLLTPKTTKPGATVAKSKGCAFLEFSEKSALQQALKLHHSELDGRQINVELTAGGGGKSEGRIAKLKERNKALNAQRTKRLKKQTTESDQATGPVTSQRFSMTSGDDNVPKTDRTWTVDEDVARSDKRKKRGSKVKDKKFSSGANSIPVG